VPAARKTYLITARARKNKRTARMLSSARKDHSIPLLKKIPFRFLRNETKSEESLDRPCACTLTLSAAL